jgi:hypothetical protein
MQVLKLNYLHLLFSILLHIVVGIMATLAPLGPPPDEAIYKDLKTVKAALQGHAGHHGYSITATSSRDQRAVYMCSKGRSYDKKGKKQDATSQDVGKIPVP